MIAQIEGKLVSLESETALVNIGSITYEVMLPSYCVSQLSGKIGQEIVLSTMEYFEGTPGGGNLIPRIVGFLSVSEREFFKRYISVKGMGIKKGLKSLAMPIATIAAAIENSDDKMLATLPSVGKKMSQMLIAELSGKLTKFAADAVRPQSAEPLGQYQLEALEILVAWGERRSEAMELIEAACKRHPDVKAAEELVPLVYRLKQGIEV